MNVDVDNLELHCPGCKRAIVDICFVPNEEGGTLSFDHALPICDWWRTAEAKQWAISIVTTAIEQHDIVRA